jgi:hypothetical protein
MTETSRVRLTDDELEEARAFTRKMSAFKRTGRTQADTMPWTRNEVCVEQFNAWLETRKEAARNIDVETCEIASQFTYVGYPYGRHEDDDHLVPDEERAVCRDLFVRSPESRGWILVADLPEEKRHALEARMRKGRDARAG